MPMFASDVSFLSLLAGLGLRKGNWLRATDSLAYLSVALCLGYFVRRSRAKKQHLPLPPCPPKGLLGHAGIMPKSFEYFTYQKWAQELDTDIIHVQLGSMIIVVLHSWEAVSTILEKKAPLYSDRYQPTMKSKVLGVDWPLSSLPYGERWRKGRALFHQHLHPSNPKLVEPRQLAFIRSQLLPQLLEGPTDIISVVRHFTAGLSISMAYGIEIQPKQDPYVILSESAMKGLIEASTPGKWLVDFFPFLRHIPAWFPGAGWKRKALRWRATMEESRKTPFTVAMKEISNGVGKPSFLLECMQAYGDTVPDPEQLELINDTASIIYGAGADTTASTINTFLVAMLCYPEVQEKARAELDRVLGPNRLPTFEDRDSLPYITAIMKEGLRWQCPNPVAVPHMSSAEGVYKGYRIPKGALVIGNVWALMHNEEDFPDPMEFKPERFLNPDGSLNDSVIDPAAAVFGFGRRLCPGRHIAFSALWMTIASILTSFRIEKGIDDDGRTIEPEPVYLTGFARVPAPFRATFKVRSKEVEGLILGEEEPHL